MEGLEGRMLLSTTSGVAEKIVQHRGVNSSSPLAQTSKDTSFDYTTAQGSRVDIQLIGPGSLAGTSLDSSGDLQLVYSGSTVFTTITGTVKGGSGVASLVSIQSANVPLDSLTGLGGDLIGRVLLPSFNLISGGEVNLLAGVQVFTVNSVSANSQVHLRDTPLNTSLGIQSYVNTVTGAGVSFATLSSSSTGATSSSASGLSSGTSIGVATGQSAGGVTTIGQGTLNPTAIGFGGGSVGAINGAIPIINTVGNGENFLGTPGLTQTEVSQGRVASYVLDSANGTQLSSLSGTFMPGANLIVPSDISLPPHRVPPPGVIVTINRVNGGATAKTPPLGDSQIYGYDATTNALIRFDAVTGQSLQSIPLPDSTTGVGGISLARDGTELVVLVGIGSNVLAFDATTGTAVGQFSIASLPAGFATVTGIATGGQTTVLADAADGPDGTIQEINVPQSLATGQAVTIGSPFSPTSQFGLAGTLTGVPGTGNVFALGSAFFDTSQPNLKQAGILTVTPGTTKLTESSRAGLTSGGAFITAGPNNGVAGSTSIALGSLDSNLALDTGAANGVNIVNLYSPNGLTSEGSFKLDDVNPLADLSQSFHPELTNTALIDVQGNVQSFTAKSATGMVLNVAGNFDLLQINNASNSSVIGLPFAHVNIPVRHNVTITTNSRLVGTRGGVTVNASQKAVGPLFID
jgi:hypothetical protein